jgi:hypothetical protein
MTECDERSVPERSTRGSACRSRQGAPRTTTWTGTVLGSSPSGLRHSSSDTRLYRGVTLTSVAAGSITPCWHDAQQRRCCPLPALIFRHTMSTSTCVPWSSRLGGGWMVGASPSRRYFVAASATSVTAASSPSGDAGSVAIASTVAPPSRRSRPPARRGGGPDPDPDTATTVSLAVTAGDAVGVAREDGALGQAGQYPVGARPGR